MSLGLRQQLKLSQQLVMTPQLQLSIKLLQQSRLELNETIEQELLSNPVLEIATDQERNKSEDKLPEIRQTEELRTEIDGDHDRTFEMDFVKDKRDQRDEETELPFNEANIENWENYIAPSYKTASTREGFNPDDEYSFEDNLTREESLRDHLLWQLGIGQMDEEAARLAIEMIGNVDAEGYFRLTYEEFLAGMGPEWTEEDKAEIDPEFFLAVLERLQTFSPTGVFARDLSECLLLQLEPLGQDDTYIGDIVRDHLDDIAGRRVPSILKTLDITKDEFARAMDLIQTLDPYPGRQFGDTGNRYITPDIYVTRVAGEYIVTLNEQDIPNLTIGRQYKNMIKRAGANGEGRLGEEERKYINDHIRSATWLIKSIQQRQSTILKVTEAIMTYQSEFLDKGVEFLRPLVLRNIANDVGMHESTVGRVTTNKYVQTPRGVFELKYFFTSSIDNQSSQSVKHRIKKLVEEEPPDKPLSDTDIIALLKGENIEIARRTVAKYRKAIGIPPSNRRRRLY